jgi:predicted alpha/beta-hydrolase family hydrolase
MDSPFMEYFSAALADLGIRVGRFEFPYMAKTRHDGKRRPPDRAPVLLDTWRTVLKTISPGRVVIGGKSLGGRIASIVADEMGAAGLICLGYPFHPPGKPEKTRVEHLAALRTPTLVIQGTRDPFGNRDNVGGYALSEAIRMHWIEDGDHGFKPRARSGGTERTAWAEAALAVTSFVLDESADSV